MNSFDISEDCELCSAELKAIADAHLNNYNLPESCLKCHGQ